MRKIPAYAVTLPPGREFSVKQRAELALGQARFWSSQCRTNLATFGRQNDAYTARYQRWLGQLAKAEAKIVRILATNLTW